jgi:Flp pilus assembly secretin CpaC
VDGQAVTEGTHKMTRAHKALSVSLIGFFSISSVCHAQRTEMHVLMLGRASLIKTDKSFSSIVIGDPKVVDVTATTDRTATVTTLMTGETNVLFLDAEGNQVEGYEVIVTEPQEARVRVHNLSRLSGYTSYRCGPTYCDRIEEVIPKEPEGRTETTTTHQ